MSTQVSFPQRIMQVLSRGFERAAQMRTRRYLIGLSDRSLEDMGFSRDPLAQGANAWPWHLRDASHGKFGSTAATPGFDNGAQAAQQDRRSVDKAVRFNRRHDDAKLAA